MLGFPRGSPSPSSEIFEVDEEAKGSPREATPKWWGKEGAEHTSTWKSLDLNQRISGASS